MILEILHVNGDNEDIQSRYHNGPEYQKFIADLKSKILKASQIGADIIYRPNLGDMTRKETEIYFTSKEDSKLRQPELKQKFPLLDGLAEVTFTLLPDGLYAPTYVDESDQMIANDPSKLVIIGGKYKQACVAAVVKNTQSRNPTAQVLIGDDVSFENKFPPIEGYQSIPHTTLERHLILAPNPFYI